MNRTCMVATPLQMLELTAGSEASFPSDQTLRVHAVSVPRQEFAQGSYFQLRVGDFAPFTWSVDDAVMRSCAMQQADAFVEQIVQQQHKYDAASLLMLGRQIRAVQTAHMIPIEPTLVVPPRQYISLVVWSGPRQARGTDYMWRLGKRLDDSKLFVRIACSWVRDVA